MGVFKAKNNATSTLAGPLGTGTLTMTVQTGHGDLFPEITGSDFSYLFLEDSVHNLEIINVTARALGADSMTIERAQLGTTARSWLAGDLVECRPEASQYQDVVNHVAATAGAHSATAIVNTPDGNIAATTVQAAINELDTEKLGLATGGTVSGAVDFTGNVTFDGAAGTVGQVLASQGTGATPAWGALPGDMSTTSTGTNSLLVTNNAPVALQLIDLATQSDLVDYSVANSAGTEYEVGSGSITSTNTGGVTWTESYGAFNETSGSACIAYGIAYGAGVWVMCDTFGRLYSSSNKVDWTYRDGGFGGSVANDVTYAGGQFIAVGEAGKLATSSDGVTWTQRASAATAMASNIIQGTAYNGTTYVIVGDGGYIASSTDGITWTNRKAAGTTLKCVGWGNGYFIAGGNAGEMVASTDGTTWAARTSGFAANGINGIAYGLVSATPTFIAVGAAGTITYSTDATFSAWAAATSSFGADIITSAIFASGKFVAVGYAGKISYDVDGQGTWTAVTPITVGNYNCIAHDGTTFLAAATGPNRSISTDGITWTLQGTAMGGRVIRGAAYGNSLYVLVGGDTSDPRVSTSSDRITWTARTSGYTTENINAVMYAGGKWVTCGDSDKMATSTDAISWTAYSGTFAGSSNITCLTYGNSVYVAAGAGAKLFTSATALSGSWTSRTSGFTADGINGLSYGLVGATQTFVAVGAGKISSSTDGSAVTWTLRSNPAQTANKHLYAAAYGAGRFVAVGQDGMLVYSSDGTTWLQAKDPGAADSWQAVTFYGGLFVMVSTTAGKIATSPDGITWTLQTTGWLAQNLAVCCDGTSFIAAGALGNILTAQVGVAALLLARTTPTFTSNGNALTSFSAGTKSVAMAPKNPVLLSVPSADFTLSAALGVQTAFAATGDVLTVRGDTTYEFEGQYILNTGTTSHTTALAFALATATVDSFEYVADCISAAENTPAATQTTHVSGVASTVINAASTAVYTIVKFKGIARFTLGGTVTPQINFSANPTGTNLMKKGSYVKFTPVGSSTAISVGPWG